MRMELQRRGLDTTGGREELKKRLEDYLNHSQVADAGIWPPCYKLKWTPARDAVLIRAVNAVGEPGTKRETAAKCATATWKCIGSWCVAAAPGLFTLPPVATAGELNAALEHRRPLNREKLARSCFWRWRQTLKARTVGSAKRGGRWTAEEDALLCLAVCAYRDDRPVPTCKRQGHVDERALSKGSNYMQFEATPYVSRNARIYLAPEIHGGGDVFVSGGGDKRGLFCECHCGEDLCQRGRFTTGKGGAVLPSCGAPNGGAGGTGGAGGYDR